MDMNDLKMGFINFAAFSVSFTDVEIWLKLTLLLVSIIYTIMKIINMSKQNKNG